MGKYNLSIKLFLSSQLVTGIGDQLFNIAIAILIFRLTGSNLLLSLTFASLYIGSIVGYFLMPLVERFRPNKAMAVIDFMSGGMVLLIIFIPIPTLFIILIVLGIMRSINKPLAQTLIPKLSNNDDLLTRVNADYQSAATLSMIVGFAIAGLFAATNSLHIAIILDAISFFLCSLMEMNIKTNDSIMTVDTDHNNKNTSYMNVLRQSVKIVIQDPLLFALVLPNALIFGIQIAFNNQLVALISSRTSHQTYYVVTEFAMAFGLLIASNWLRRRNVGSSDKTLIRQWLISILIVGMTYSISSISKWITPIIILLFLSSVADGISNIGQTQLLHKRVNNVNRNQIYSLRFVIRNLGKALISFLSGLSISIFGIHSTLFILGGLIMIISIGIYGNVNRLLQKNQNFENNVFL